MAKKAVLIKLLCKFLFVLQLKENDIKNWSQTIYVQ